MPTIRARTRSHLCLARGASALPVLIALVVALGPIARPEQALAQSPESIEGKWYGMAGFPQDRVELGLEIRRNEAKELKAFLYQPVVNFYAMELTTPVTRDGDTYGVPDLGMTLTFKAGALEGTFTSLKVPITLQRTDRLPADVPVPALPVGPGPKWRSKLASAIWATAAVREGTAYVGTAGGVFHAVSVRDGKLLWTFDAGRPLHGEAVATDRAVFFVCDNGFLFKLERATGKEVWRYDLGDAAVARVLPHRAVFEYDYQAPRPTLHDGILYVGAADGGFHAVDAESGQRRWRFQGKGKIRADALVRDSQVVFGTIDGVLYAVDRATGTEAWKKDLKVAVTSTPVLVGDRIVVGSRSAALYALKPDTGETLWRQLFWGSWVESTAVPFGEFFYIGSSDLRRVAAYDPKDGRVVWRTDVFGCPWGRPAVTEKRVYTGAVGADPYMIRHLGSMVALDRATGKIAWRWPMPEWPGSYLNGFAASGVVEGDTLVIGGLDGTLYGFPAE